MNARQLIAQRLEHNADQHEQRARENANIFAITANPLYDDLARGHRAKAAALRSQAAEQGRADLSPQ